jgi:hypothetical protein
MGLHLSRSVVRIKLAVAVWIYTTWYLLDDGVFAGCVGTWVYRYTLVQHRSIFATKAV